MKVILLILLVLLSPLAEARRSKNYAILINTSKFWFNYRQTTNSLLIYNFLKENGIPDENIIQMNPENIACNCRNIDPGKITSIDEQYEPNIYAGSRTDYKMDDVSVSNILGLLANRLDPRTPFGKRLSLDSDSTLLVYMNGHGGDNYFKIQDTDAFTDDEFAKALNELAAKLEYKEVLLISDSCSAFTIFDKTTAPRAVMIGSSSSDEYSFSKGKDSRIDLPKVDRGQGRDMTIQDWFDSVSNENLGGSENKPTNPQITWTHKKKQPKSITTGEFFYNQIERNTEKRCVSSEACGKTEPFHNNVMKIKDRLAKKDSITPKPINYEESVSEFHRLLVPGHGPNVKKVLI